MEKLITNARQSERPRDADIDWSLAPVPPLWFRKRTYVRLVSQFYHGEMMIQRLCRRLLTEIDDPQSRQLIDMQLADEIRHAAQFETYLARLGDIAEVEDALGAALEQSLAWKGSHLALIAAFHVVFEGGALAVLQRLNARLPCPLLGQINARLFPDEARHIAFGRHYLQRHLPALHEEERIEIYRWLKAVWAEAAVTARRRYTWPVAMVSRLGKDWLNEEWETQSRALVDVGMISEDQRLAA